MDAFEALIATLSHHQSNMHPLDRIRQDLLAEGREDYVGLWEVVWRLKRSKPMPESDEIRELALEIFRPLLREGLMEPGVLQPNGGFLAWTCTPDEALARIDAEWRALGQDPYIGQVGHFTNTLAGDQAAERDDE